MRVGLFGGSFNPPHQGHLHISGLALKKLRLNQIWWIPTEHNPLKQKSIYESYESRHKKCQEITKNHPKLYVKNFAEIRTVKLIKMLQKKYPSHEFFWIAGADNLPRLHEWDDYKNLIKLLPFAIFSREDFLSKIHKTKAFTIYKKLRACGPKTPEFKIFLTKNLNISSTKIRNAKLHR